MAYKILLGDHHDHTASYAHDLWGDTCQLLTINNHHDRLTKSDAFYTGLGDWYSHPDQLFQVLVEAEQVVVAPFMLENHFDMWDPTNTESGMVRVMSLVLDKIYNRTKIVDHNHFELTHQASYRIPRPANQKKTLWVFGCSMTQGDGVQEHQRWANCLAAKLNLPLKVVAESGSSVQWAADMILRSDLHEDDIVVWGVTEHARFSWYANDRQYHAHNWYLRNNTELPQLPVRHIGQLLTSDHLLHLAIVLMNQVENFCHKLKINLLMFGVLTSDSINLQMSDKSNFIPYFRFDKTYIDYGNDNIHPGPQEHSLIANILCDKLYQLNYV